MSGLSRTPGKRVWVNSPPRVRIPPSPPDINPSDFDHLGFFVLGHAWLAGSDVSGRGRSHAPRRYVATAGDTGPCADVACISPHSHRCPAGLARRHPKKQLAVVPTLFACREASGGSDAMPLAQERVGGGRTASHKHLDAVRRSSSPRKRNSSRGTGRHGSDLEHCYPYLAVCEAGGVNMRRSSKMWMCLCLALGLTAGGMPAQASEVVKLARLVVSGKRSANDAPRPAPAEARSAAGSVQGHGSGGTDAAGTAPAPTRGVS